MPMSVGAAMPIAHLAQAVGAASSAWTLRVLRAMACGSRDGRAAGVTGRPAMSLLLAAAYQAMVAERPYREQLSEAEALDGAAELSGCATRATTRRRRCAARPRAAGRGPDGGRRHSRVWPSVGASLCRPLTARSRRGLGGQERAEILADLPVWSRDLEFCQEPAQSADRRATIVAPEPRVARQHRRRPPCLLLRVMWPSPSSRPRAARMHVSARVERAYAADGDGASRDGHPSARGGAGSAGAAARDPGDHLDGGARRSWLRWPCRS